MTYTPDTKAQQEAQWDRLLVAAHLEGRHQSGDHPVECKLCREGA